MKYDAEKPQYTVPVGEYVVMIDGVTVDPYDKGNFGFKFVFVIVGGAYHGKTIKQTIFSRSKQLWELTKALSDVEIVGKKTQFDPEDWRGRYIKIKNGHRMYNGNEYNDIQSIYKYETTGNEMTTPKEGEDKPEVGGENVPF